MSIKPWFDLSESEVIEAVSHLRSAEDIDSAASPTLIESTIKARVPDPEVQRQLLDRVHTLSREREF